MEMMESTKSPKEQFIELIAGLQRAKGLDELTSKLFGILFIETKDIALDELAKRTGYSLSAVCTSMKMLERSGIVKKSRKPGSKKIYLYMEGDLMSMFIEIMKRSENMVSMLKERVPGIIDDYRKLEKSGKSDTSNEELRIIENYYEQLLSMEDIMKKLLEMLDNAYAKLRKKQEAGRGQR
jgi:DNA-binding transcriptional regulator GbsR (MarR family)